MSTPHMPLRIVQQERKDGNDGSTAGFGMTAALEAMVVHWAVNLREGESCVVMERDLEKLEDRVRALRQSIRGPKKVASPRSGTGMFEKDDEGREEVNSEEGPGKRDILVLNLTVDGKVDRHQALNEIDFILAKAIEGENFPDLIERISMNTQPAETVDEERKEDWVITANCFLSQFIEVGEALCRDARNAIFASQKNHNTPIVRITF